MAFLPGIAAALILCTWSRCSSVHADGDSSQCTNLLPGLSQMARGVDVSRFDLTPLDDNDDDGVRDAVVSFTCRRGKTTKGLNGVETFQVPDQNRLLIKMPGDLSTSQTRLFKTIDDVINWIRTNDGGYDEIFDYAFTDSGSFRKIEDDFLNRGFNVVVDVSAYTSATRASLHLPWGLALTTKANNFLAVNVTGDFDDNPRGYNKFIDIFGTHFLDSVDFGGYVQSIIGINNDTYLYTHSDDVIKRNAKALFQTLVSNDSSKVGSGAPDKDFLDSSVVLTKCYGGNTTLFRMGLMDEWRTSLAKDPQKFYSILKPIYELIRDSKKKDSMKKAVEIHIIKSYATELKRRVKLSETKIGVTEVTRINNKIDTLLGKSKDPLALVKELKSKVDDEIIVPEWFRMNTSFCLQTDSIVNKQCSQGQISQGQIQCSKPNQMTTKVDTSLWGCALQWGVTSFNYPAWFEEFEVCFRNHASGDGSKGCAGTSAQDMCAQVNSFTPSFVTSLDNGSCDVSWSLNTPGYAPAWMKTIELCFHWYPRQNGQCSNMLMTRCAKVNQWTSYHTLTSGDGAVCGMSWSMKTDMF